MKKWFSDKMKRYGFLIPAFCVLILSFSSTSHGIQGKDDSAVPVAAPKEVVNPARMNASAPTWTTEGGRVPLSVDASGGLRVTGSISGRTLTGSSAFSNPSTATTTQLVAASGSLQIKVYNIMANVGNGQVLTFVYGTGSNCATGLTAISHGISFANGAGTMGLLSAMSPNFPIFTTPAGKALCVTTGSAVASTGITVSYIQE